MTPIIMWALQATQKGTTANTSATALSFVSITRPSKTLSKRIQTKLNETLGKAALTQPPGQPP